MPDVRLPDGRIIKNVPEGTTKEQLTSKLVSSGVLTGQEDFTQPKQDVIRTQEPQPEVDDSRDRFKAAREKTNREFGLGARAVLQGISSPVTIIPDLATLGINKAFGTDIQPLSSIVSEGLTTVGFPEPKTGGERFISAGIEAGTGAGIIKKGLQAVTTKQSPKLIQTLASGPVSKEIGAGVGAGLATQGATELGFESVPAKIAIGVAGGLAGGKLTPSRTTPKAPAILEDVAESGIDDVATCSQVKESLSKEATKQQKKISKLFTSATEKGKEATIDSKNLTKLSDDLLKEVDDVIDIDGKSFLESTSKTLGSLSDSSAANTVNKLESFRRQASQVVRKDKAGSEGAKRVLEKIDGFLDDVEIQGDPDTVKLWKDAIKARREFGQKFENPKKIAKILDEEATIESIEREFIGTGPVMSKKDLARTYNETLRALPAKQRKDVAFALRQSVVNRMIKTAAQSTDSEAGLSASRLSNQIRNLRRENKSFWDKYTPQEKQVLSKLETELRNVSSGKGAIKKTFAAISKFIPSGAKFDIEIPRTLKAKTAVSIDELLELSASNPAQKSIAPVIATQQSIQE